jgi:glycosyltransferase involved in cell wall biosynthesis
MKILHLSHNGLPDTRVERVAQTGKKAGIEVFFAGPFIKKLNLPRKSFDKFYETPFNRFANAKLPRSWRLLKNKFSEIIEESRPDLVHAHNIVAAKLASELELPFIYDDHEYWSKQIKLRLRTRKPQIFFLKWLWTRWEKEILHKASAVITVSRTIAEEHKKICDHVYVVPNFPSCIETKSLKLGINYNKKLSSTYVGLPDFSSANKYVPAPHRNTQGVLEIFSRGKAGTLTVIGDPYLLPSENIYSLGVLNHQKIMNELTKYHIGLVPWKKHWYHKYCNPNKPYEYTHAGLLVIAVSDLPCVTQHLKDYCITFNEFDELEEILHYYARNLNEVLELKYKIRKFALKNLIWEKECEPKIIQAYSKI